MATNPWVLSGILLVGLTAILAVFYAWTYPPASPITAAEARAEIRARHFGAIIDVRSDAEWAAGHYSAAEHIPLDQLRQRLPRVVPHRSTPILFYCHSGRRAATAAALAQDLGYQYVWYLSDVSYTELEPRHHFLNV